MKIQPEGLAASIPYHSLFRDTAKSSPNLENGEKFVRSPVVLLIHFPISIPRFLLNSVALTACSCIHA